MTENFRRIVDTYLTKMSHEGLEREALLVLAQTLQARLQGNGHKLNITCYKPLEVLMRAVAGILENTPKNGDYVAEKWHYASTYLPAELSAAMPLFSATMKTLKGE